MQLHCMCRVMDAEEAVTCGTVLDHCIENAELTSLVTTLPQVCRELRSREAADERFMVILDKYQEQPHLLDPYLEDLVKHLFGLVRQPDSDPRVIQQAFRFLYLLSKVRGSKVIVRWFPHEVSDLYPGLSLLQQQDPHDHNTWETRYILLLWLSIIVIIPFDLCRLDGSSVAHTTIDCIFDVAKMYVAAKDKCRDAAALLMAKFVSRPDVRALKMGELIDWSLEVMATADKSSMSSMVLLSGVLATLSAIFKHGKREDVVVFASSILSHLSACDLAHSTSSQLRKLHIKLTQWLGVTFLPPRVATWRYQRGGRSIGEALLTTRSSQTVVQSPRVEEEEEYEVPPELEEVLELLIAGLQDKDTVVRWGAAKGVGRVTGRLPRDLANEVVQSLLDFFTCRGNDAAWHGGCLALAELGRRGLLLPQRLAEVVPVVLKALEYDERRGSYSVGANVRDAACYVIWSFARTYQPEELKPYITAIASGLVIAMLFDREVNCRKAASAAFQENVGRQGTFPHGIDILTVSDYFAVGSRSNAYLNISVQVAKFPEYTRPLIDHLIHSKLLHWDSAVRELAAEALHNLTPLDHLYLRDTVLPSLLPLVTSSDPCLRHGALRAVVEVVCALYDLATSEGKSFRDYVGEEVTSSLLEVAPRLQEAGVFRGAVGEVMRPAVLKFIKGMCLSALPAHGLPVLEVWQGIVNENLAHTEEEIRDNAVSAFSALCRYYITDKEVIRKSQDKLIPFFTSQLLSHSHITRMGFALGLGGLPKPLLVGYLRAVLDPLMKSCLNIKNCDSRYTEARRDAVLSITRIYCTVAVSIQEESCDVKLCAEDIEAVFGIYSVCMGDYTTDSRGDIGATVREAAMNGIRTVSSLLAVNNPHFLTPEMISRAMCGLVQQCNEKIDRTRGLACETLIDLIFHEPSLPHIPHHPRLMEIFKDCVVGKVDWLAPHLTFPLTVQLLDEDCYRYSSLLGLLVSVGGLTESTVRQSSSALLGYLQNISSSVDTLDPFANTLLQILGDHTKEIRVILPLFKVFDLLLSNGVFDVYSSLEDHPFPSTLLNLLKAELKLCRDVVKILASINVYCELLQFPSIRHSTLASIMLLLCHNFPRVRKSTAEQLYVTLLTFDDLFEAGVSDVVMGVISETTWDGHIDSVRENRNKICELLHLPIPKLLTRSIAKPKPSSARDDLSSYKDLVERAGY